MYYDNMILEEQKLDKVKKVLSNVLKIEIDSPEDFDELKTNSQLAEELANNMMKHVKSLK
jgi:hypothetical protein